MGGVSIMTQNGQVLTGISAWYYWRGQKKSYPSLHPKDVGEKKGKEDADEEEEKGDCIVTGRGPSLHFFDVVPSVRPGIKRKPSRRHQGWPVVGSIALRVASSSRKVP